MNHLAITSTMFQRGKVSLGNPARIHKLIEKLRQGRKVVYGAIGGSITEGAGATCQELRYVEQFAAWLREHYRNPGVEVVNAGIGASNSLFGAFRVEKDLLSHAPDLITVEYAVNDTTNPDTAAAYEALLRKCLKLSPDTAVILISTMNYQGENKQHLHIPSGTHYQLPMISYRDAVYPEVSAGRIVWSDISPDTVHPNNLGHTLIKDLLVMLMQELETVPEAVPSPLPDYLNPGTARYERVSLADAGSMEVLNNSGWQTGPHKGGYTGWQTTSPAATLEVRFSARYIVIGCKQYSGDFGRALATIDDRPPVMLEGYFQKLPNNDWAGGHTVLTMLAEDLPPGSHTLRVQMLSERHPDSQGHEFDIGYLLLAE